jgi:putative protease
LLEFLHRRGVKGYVTFNTLVFENEMAEAEQHARAIIAAGVDAAIVQDVGICRLIRRLSPEFPIHVSTQMTITSAEGVEFARELGCNLVVLARECSLKEIEKILAPKPSSDGATTSNVSLPLEVFVHGALCVAYSGQCLTSEALGGRSANRGECAQACRMPYDLIADGQQVPLGDRKYLLSPQDLAGLEMIPDLARLGIASLKIEGRLKSPEYVANITRIYRQALDRLSQPARGTDGTHSTTSHTAERASAVRNGNGFLARSCTRAGSVALTTRNWSMAISAKNAEFISEKYWKSCPKRRACDLTILWNRVKALFLMVGTLKKKRRVVVCTRLSTRILAPLNTLRRH